MTTETTLYHLPNEVFARIFSFLPRQDLYNVPVAFCLGASKTEEENATNPLAICHLAIRHLATWQLAKQMLALLPQKALKSYKFKDYKGVIETGKAAHRYLRSGYNSATRLTEVENEKSITDSLPLDLLKEFAEYEEKSRQLYWCASQGDEAGVVAELGKEDVWINAADSCGSTALMFAAFNGHNNIVKSLLQNGADVNAAKTGGCTALIIAAENGHKDIVESLLQNGADVNAVEKNGETALMFAAWKDHKDVVDLLLQNGANFKAADPY